MFDIGIIGGGPGGYVAAIKAAQMGASCVLFEEERVGGVCLNRGCIPTKTLLKSAGVLATVRGAEAFGVTATGVSFDYARVARRKDDVVSRLTGGVAALLKKNGVTVVPHRATATARGVIAAGGETFEAKNIILATGSVSATPPIPGIEHTVNSDGMLAATTLPASAAIIGGGVIGVEFAMLLAGFGVPVTIVEMLPDILATADAEVIKTLRGVLQKAGVAIHTGARVLSVDEKGLTFAGAGGGQTHLNAELVLCATGRVPNTDTAMLDRLGVRHHRGAIETDEKMRTSMKGIYAIGDVNGKWMLAHKASAEGIVAVKNILGEAATMAYDKIPQCIYTTPEAAWVGLTQAQAEAAGIPVRVGTFPMAGNGKSMAEGDTTGFVKLIAAESGEILGGHLVCAHATDMISEITLLMELEGLAEDAARTIHPHPTVSEAVMEAAEAVTGHAIHI